MPTRALAPSLSLAEQLETVVRRMTHGRIRDLAVEEEHGRVVLRGQAPTHHLRQMALHAVLELVSGDEVLPLITVG